MSVRTWWERWGPWVGPSSVMILLAMLTRLDACSATPWSAVDKLRSIDKRMDALEGRIDDQAALNSEFRRVTDMREAMVEQHDKELALLKLQSETSARDLSDIKSTVEWIRRNMRVGGPAQKGSWGSSGG